MPTDIHTGLQGFKFLIDSIKALGHIRDHVLVDRAVVDLLRQLRETETEFATLRARVQTLERELAECEDWKSEAERYELQHVGNRCFAYLEKGFADRAGPAPMLCPNCFAERRKSPLQCLDDSTPEIGALYKCGRCKTAMALNGRA